MNSELVIHEISSDEEGGLNEDGGVSHDWLWDFLGDSEGEGSDDVEILDGVTFASMKQKKDCVDSGTIGGGSGNDSDDDCLVLAGDPDNPVSAVDEEGNGSDDLLVVGEKGQSDFGNLTTCTGGSDPTVYLDKKCVSIAINRLACRDYPHSRHLCAKFPFSTTPHEKYCNLCHCYVCDSLAPCIYWGTGGSFNDHCNSTDKEEAWRTQRQRLQKSIKAGPPVQRLPDTTLSMRVPLHNTQPPHSFSEPLSLRLVPKQASVSEPVEWVARPVTSFGTTGNRRPNPHSRFRNRYPQYHPNESIQLIPRTQTNTRGRGGVSGSHFVPPHSRFKRPGSSGSSSTVLNRSGQGSHEGNRLYTALQPRSQSMQATAGDDIQLKKWQNLLYGIDSELDTNHNTPGPNSNCNVTDFQAYSVSSLPQVQAHDQPFPQFEANQNVNQFGNSAPNATDPDPLGFNYSWPLNVASQSTPSEASTVMQSEGQHLQNLASLEFHEEHWMHNPIDHRHPIPETASNPMLPDLDFLSFPPSPTDSLFYGLESPWVI